MPTQNAPESMYRSTEGLGVWEHRGKVAAVGIGHSPTSRRWDGKPETSIGALGLDALRKAIADAGVSPDQVDGLVMAPGTTTGSRWEKDDPIPMDVVNAFNPTDDLLDGVAQYSAEWILKNMPELTNVNFTMYGPGCMSNAIVVAAQAIGDGLAHTVLVLKGWHNLPGRYYQGGDARQDTVGGRAWGQLWGTRAGTTDAWTFQQYLDKYGKTHDMMAPFVVNSRRNGLLFPEGFYAQHRPHDVLTAEDYATGRWIVKPLNIYDMDMPVMAAAAYLFTTPERAKDMKQKPVYILNHCTTRPKFGLHQGLENAMLSTESTARKIYSGAGITARDLSFENMYDGFTVFHNHYLEGLGYAGIKRGEVLDFYKTDISIEGPNPVSPSGGNSGSGRTRFWMHTDSIQQIQGRAGARQIRKPAEIGISGGPMPQGGDFTVWGASPD
ncbi:MAG: putative thiolase [Dehalococcoidia bacterium]|nr:putative thiolase [Dehalococcoidia bacterium]